MECVSFLGFPGVEDRFDLCRATVYVRIKQGLLPPPVNLGGRRVAFPEVEVDAVARARLAGKSDAQIRDLVSSLIAKRSRLAEVTQ